MIIRALIIVALLGAAALPAAGQFYDNAKDPTVLAVRKALPSVVSITTEGTVTVTVNQDPMAQMFREFQGLYQPNPLFQKQEQRRVGGFGSGVIIDAAGFIITNQHNLRNARDLQITVVLADGRKFKAAVLLMDPMNDLALLKVDTQEPLPAIELEDSDATLLGQTVIAMGNPFGLENTVTRGILSSKSRNVRSGGMQYEELLQTDAAINPGNSGGALVDLNGRMVGMNVLVLARSQGISFAIPTNRIIKLLGDFFSLERQKNLNLGLTFADMGGRIVVFSVSPSSPAFGKLAKGDVVEAVDGKAFRSALSLVGYLLQGKKAGDAVELAVQRQGQRGRIALRLDPVVQPLGMKMLGISFQYLTPELAPQLGYGPGDGLLVVDVDQQAQPYQIGLRPGMVVSSLNSVPLKSPDDINRALANVKPGATIPAVVLWSQKGPGNQYFRRQAQVAFTVR